MPRMGCVALLSCAAALAACGGSDDGLLGDVTNANASATDSAREEAALAESAARITLTIEAGGVGGAPGGTVHVTVGSSPAVAVSTGSPGAFTITAGDAVTLAAVAASGYRFASWTLSGGLSCESPPGSGARCGLDTRSAVAGASVAAAFAVSGNAVGIAVGPGGDLSVMVGSRSPGTVLANSIGGFTVASEDTLTLTAEPRDGYTFARWALPPGLSCTMGTDNNVCELATGSIDAATAFDALFEAIPSTLTVTAGTGGMVRVGISYSNGNSQSALVAARLQQGFRFNAEARATLTAEPVENYRFLRWTLSGPSELACASGTEASPCALAVGSVTADAAVSASFALIPRTLAVTAGTGGSVDVEVNRGRAVTVSPGPPQAFTVNLLPAATTLTAKPAEGYRFARWTLSVPSGLACESGTTTGPSCVLGADSLTANAAAEASFALIPRTLTVTAGANGSVHVAADGGDAVTVDPGPSQEFAVNLLPAATTLEAVPDTGYRFARWTLSSDTRAPVCGFGATPGPSCVLAVGSVTADAAAEASFELIPITLTVTAGAGGSVDVEADGGDAVTVSPGPPQEFAVNLLPAATTLEAVPDTGYRFARWTLSSDTRAPVCESGATPGPSCVLAAGSVTADAAAEASFELIPRTLTVTARRGGSADVAADGGDAVTVNPGPPQEFAVNLLPAATTLEAIPAEGYRFDRWTLSGPSGLACESGTTNDPSCVLAVGSVTADAAAEASFELIPTTLTVTAGANGVVQVKIVDSAALATEGDVLAGNSKGFAFGILSTATLTAVPASGHGFANWTLPDGLACASGTTADPSCVLAAGSLSADAAVSATFFGPGTLTVTVGANGVVFVGATRIRANSSHRLIFGVKGVVGLEASPSLGHLVRWTLSGAPAPCASGTHVSLFCVLPVTSLIGDKTLSVTFDIQRSLRVTNLYGGPVDVEIDDRTVTLRSGARQDFAATILSVATLTATASDGFAFSHWTLSGPSGLACASGTTLNPTCVLAAGSLSADAAVEANFVALQTLRIAAGVGGSVDAEIGDRTVTLGSGARHDFDVSVLSSATLTSDPLDGYRFDRWTLSGPPRLACADGTAINLCVLPTGSFTDRATVRAAFEIIPRTLTVTAGVGGSVVAGGFGAVMSDSPQGFSVNVQSKVTLTADPLDGYRFLSWTLAGLAGLACESRMTTELTCVLPTGSLSADAMAEASFEAVQTTLTVVAGNGAVVVRVAGDGIPSVEDATVGASSSTPFGFNVLSTATLTAEPAEGYEFIGWTLSGGGRPAAACESGPQDSPCVLPANSVTADATVEAVFEIIPRTLTVTAGDNGKVLAAVDRGDATTLVLPDAPKDFTVTIQSMVALTVDPVKGYRIARWTLSDGLACESMTTTNPTCVLTAGSVTDDATAEASFEPIPSTLTVTAGTGGDVGTVIAYSDGNGLSTLVSPLLPRRLRFDIEAMATLTAEPAEGYEFTGWTLSGGGAPAAACAGRPQDSPCVLAIGSVTADATVEANFALTARILTVTAVANGKVVVEADGGDAVTVNPGPSQEFNVNRLRAATTLTADPFDYYRFDRWTLSGPPGLACASGTTAELTCVLPAGSVTADATAEASFEPIPSTLTVSVSPPGINLVRATITYSDNSGREELVNSSSNARYPFDIEATATLRAEVLTDGYEFSHWTLVGGGTPAPACASGAESNPCVLPTNSVQSDAMVVASFEPIPSTLNVSVRRGGAVHLQVSPGGGGEDYSLTVNAPPNSPFPFHQTRRDFSVLSSATLTAEPADGYEFSRWALSGGGTPATACARGMGTGANICALAVGSVTADATVVAHFGLIPRILTVTAEANGSVNVEADGVDAVTVGPGPSQEFNVNFRPEATTLTADPLDHYRFVRWTLSSPSGLACESGTTTEPTCVLPIGSVTADATVVASFEPIPSTLTVTAGANGRVDAEVDLGTASGLFVSTSDSLFSRSKDYAFNILSSAELTAIPVDNYEFAGWTLSDGLACASGTTASLTCALPQGSVTADATVSANFDPIERTLTVDTGENGSVNVEVDGGDAMPVRPGSPKDFTVTIQSRVTVTPEPADGYRFSFWTFRPGSELFCSSGSGATNSCELRDGFSSDEMIKANFEAVPITLTVAAGTDGMVTAELADRTATIGAGSSESFAFSILSSATLTATATAAGYELDRWTLSGAPAPCESGTTTSRICVLPAGSVRADATVQAHFGISEFLLTVHNSVEGATVPNNLDDLQVRVFVNNRTSFQIDAGRKREIIFTVEDTARLEAVSTPGWTFSRWTEPPGQQSCFPVDDDDNVCTVALGQTGFVRPGAPVRPGVSDRRLSIAAVFVRVGVRPPAAWMGPGPVRLSGGSAHTAVPYAPGAFENWAGAPCDGSTQPECDFSSVMAEEPLPVAVFRPFVVGGIKSLVFGLDYHGDPPDHFRVSLRDAPGSGFLPVPVLDDLAPGPWTARLPVSVHLLPWELGTYLTEACDAANRCAPASNGERALEQSDSVAATGYFKAPNAGAFDEFGAALALSADGSTLAVGAFKEDGASAGVFAPGGAGYQAALNSNGAHNNGAVTVYRRSVTDDLWALEAFVKSPRGGTADEFGHALALSADGATLAVGAPGEDSASTGTFAPGGAGYQAALGSDGTSNSGAVTVYRRSGSAWSVEAFVKAPVAGVNDQFGFALALSGDGATLAAGAFGEDSASTGTFAPGGAGYRTALESGGEGNSGAVTVYRRSDADAWEIEAFVKAPKAGGGDEFGIALALDSNGTTLAVGAFKEDSASTGTFTPGGAGYQAALDSDGTSNSGAVTVYRRSTLTDTWAIEAFVKAPKAGGDRFGDEFGGALALDSSGTTLAVGAFKEDSASTGAFTPGGADYQAALDSDGTSNSGAVTVYRRSGSAWSIEAFVKAPVAGVEDRFGSALALSADGATLAVGAPTEDSASIGAFTAPNGTGYQTALDSGGASNSGAVTVYRRSEGNDWEIEAFVKAPIAGVNDDFGTALALSANGATLAVGEDGEDGGALSQPVGGDSADPENAVNNSGAVYLY